jgi:hypothetical protein
MIDVKEQRQQIDKNLLARFERRFGPGEAGAIHLEKSLLDLFEAFSIDTFVEFGHWAGSRHAGKYRRQVVVWRPGRKKSST